MLGILARSFMTATGTAASDHRPDAAAAREARRRWLPQGHWWIRAGETPERAQNQHPHRHPRT